MIILRKTNYSIIQKEFANNSSFDFGEINMSNYRGADLNPKVINYTPRGTSNISTIEVTPKLIRKANQRYKVKQEAVSFNNRGGNKKANKALIRQKNIIEGSRIGSKKSGLVRGEIVKDAGIKYTNANPNWNNPLAGKAQQESLRFSRSRNSRIPTRALPGTELTKDQRINRLSDKYKIKLERSLSKKKNIDPLTAGLSKEERINRLSNNRKDILLKNRQIRHNNSLPAVIQKPKTNLPSVQSLMNKNNTATPIVTTSYISRKEPSINVKQSAPKPKPVKIITVPAVNPTTNNKITNEVPKLQSPPSGQTSGSADKVVNSGTQTPKAKTSQTPKAPRTPKAPKGAKTTNIFKGRTGKVVGGSLLAGGALLGAKMLYDNKKKRNQGNDN